MSSIPVRWPHGQTTVETVGDDWLKAASNADVSIPTGCLGGSCGACEIEVNGKMVRASSAPCHPQNQESWWWHLPPTPTGKSIQPACIGARHPITFKVRIL